MTFWSEVMAFPSRMLVLSQCPLELSHDLSNSSFLASDLLLLSQGPSQHASYGHILWVLYVS